ncbi:cupin domain-containing protein [Halapricum sp. CBA1109]|uniref:cupin domain-containing protein n=1 Tax=Halapricum sp. CBA1109 TaxID=2668068 RepID=UPI0012FADCF8|nr:cupin domain-containing protein [Halapricum sp. CBA1109]MUV90511.1 cupin domain-containing protein [Halapricum sp. CBA1109]
MGYHVTDPDALAPADDYPCDRRSITGATGLAALHLARYRMAPGEDLARAYHYHELREEAFYVLEGPLHVETPEGTYTVETDSVFVAEPDSPHRPHNPADADGPVTVLGVGAPRSDPALPYDPEE